MPHLAQTQKAFAEAVVDNAITQPALVRGIERRFAVYRNNVAMGLFSALSTRYPVVKRLVGDEFFREMSRRHVAVEPPRSPIMLYYGEMFPAFIEAFEPARPIPYLGAIARIEMARGLAYHAADATSLTADVFAGIAPDRFVASRVTLHPSVSVVSSQYPIYSIWKVNQSRSPVVPVSPWAAEAALIARPSYTVQVHKLADGQEAFLRALGEGQTIAEAIEAGQASAARFDVAQSLALLIRTGSVVELGGAATNVRAIERTH